MPVRLRPEERDKKDILAAKFEIEHEDVFHFKNLYKRVYEWLVDEGFSAAESDGKDQNYEILYFDQEAADGNKRHQIWWRAYTVPKGNRYYRYFIKIDFQTLYVKKHQIMHKGQKFSTNISDTIIRVEAWLQLDYNNDWGENSIMRRLEPWFRERFYLENIKSYRDDLYRISYRLHSVIKQYLQFKMAEDWGKSFHPERGV